MEQEAAQLDGLDGKAKEKGTYLINKVNRMWNGLTKASMSLLNHIIIIILFCLTKWAVNELLRLAGITDNRIDLSNSTKWVFSPFSYPFIALFLLFVISPSLLLLSSLPLLSLWCWFSFIPPCSVWGFCCIQRLQPVTKDWLLFCLGLHPLLYWTRHFCNPSGYYWLLHPFLCYLTFW